jgi:Leucine-rich repeat (LRR) protein
VTDGDLPGPTSNSPPPSASSLKWFHFRGWILLLLPVAVLLLLAMYVPRQMQQARALAALKQLDVPIRTQPLPIPGIESWIGKEYAVEVIDVYMRDPRIQDADLHAIGGLRSLQKLELVGSQITSSGLANLKRLPNLYILHLANTPITDEGLVHLTQFPNLGILSLDQTAITDEGLRHVGTLPHLERLYLDGTKITDKGLEYLSAAEGLIELSCVGTPITDAGIQHLYGLKKLEVLKVYNTSVTREALEKLHTVLPQCMIWEPSE